MKRICNGSARLAAICFADKMTNSKVQNIYGETDYGTPFRDVLESLAINFDGNVRKVPNKARYIVTFIDKNGNVEKLRY